MTNSPVQPVTISPPIKFSVETSGVVHNEEISELKERLQLAEKQLQNEQQLLHVVMEKVCIVHLTIPLNVSNNYF